MRLFLFLKQKHSLKSQEVDIIEKISVSSCMVREAFWHGNNCIPLHAHTHITACTTQWIRPSWNIMWGSTHHPSHQSHPLSLYLQQDCWQVSVHACWLLPWMNCHPFQRLSGMHTDPLSVQEDCSLMLIQYMDLNLQRLNQVLAGTQCCVFTQKTKGSDCKFLLHWFFPKNCFRNMYIVYVLLFKLNLI